jgi:tetraacyldisaccharide 4'-kinase
MRTTSAIAGFFIPLLYAVCRILAFPLFVFYFLYRIIRNRRYARHFNERLGGTPVSFKPTARGSIWLHAVSVGEVISSIRLIEELRAGNPHIPIFVSVSTLAGRATADEKLASLADGVFYAPIDYAFAIRRVISRIRPAVLVVLETEIWPALYREVKRASCGLMIVNGRISERAFPRYRLFRFFFQYVLELPDAIFVQSEADRARYLELGAPAEKTTVFGNLKYDLAAPSTAPPKPIADLIASLQPRAVWIAASTMPGLDASDVDEDKAVINAFRMLAPIYPGLLLILVPRKPERFDSAARKLSEAGVAFLRRSEIKLDAELELPGVLLLDTIGELAALFPLADVVFMGGTLAERGGHNILEPAICGRPIIIGPHMENFDAIAADFRAHDAIVEIRDASELAGSVDRLLADSALRANLGARCRELAMSKRGVAAKAAVEILKIQDAAIPVWMQPGPSKPILWLFSRLWIWGAQRKRASNWAQSRVLHAPVVSIGGISMGGVGKTPLVGWLAEKLRGDGFHPAILTRGYRRKSIETNIVVPAGARMSAQKTGDEPQILIRTGFAHVGIGADRWATGCLLEEQLHPDIFLLDDGFQHWRLRRQMDIVLIDALDPFAGNAVFPLGRLREPVEALARADAIILTRAQPLREYEGIKARIRAVNPSAPILLAKVEPESWVNERTRQPSPEPPGPAVAFCGLANPGSFWQTLLALDITPVFRWAFDDHHHYTHRELKLLAMQAQLRGARALLTTEKDAMNLPENALEILGPAELYWLKIGTELEDEATLMELIESRLEARS